MTRRVVWLALVALVAMPLVAPVGSGSPPAAAQSVWQGGFGLEFGQVIDNNGTVRFTDEIAAEIVRSGANWVHVNFRLGGFKDWTETESFGYSALSLYDEVVATAQRHGLYVVGLLSNEAWHGSLDDWQAFSAETGQGNGDNLYLQEFTQQAAVVLTRHFSGRVDHWEVWNEPNAAPTYLYPSNFAWLLARVYQEVRAAGISTPHLISGGLSSVQESTGETTAYSTGADYLRATYAQGKQLAAWEEIRAANGSYPLDAIGQHLYVDGYRRTQRATIQLALQLVRDAYIEGEQGSDAKRTIITEMGWSSGNVSQQTQADNLQYAFAEVAATSYVQAASWFFLRDEPAADLDFGLLRPDGAEKLAWHGYRNIISPEAPPLVPADVRAVGLATEIRLIWRASAAPDLAGYQVFRGTDLNAPFTQLTPTPITEPTFLDVGAPAGVPVFYRVKVLDSGGHVSGDSMTVGAMRADHPTLPPFEQTWTRTDAPVADSRVQRTWMWGAEPFSQVITERYDDSPNGYRQVQYFDKSRMELTHPEADPNADWYVTNGLLVNELMTGWMQSGDDAFIERDPAAINIAGDPDSGPTYAAVSPLRWAAARQEGELITRRVQADGSVTHDPSLGNRDVKAAHYVAATRHTIATPFWEFMNFSGIVIEGGEETVDNLFVDPFYATGYPITEAYWTQVTVAGVPMDVLIQCFQRRCLTYTPDNPPGWQVEAGNVGLHYHRWRYGEGS